MCKLVSHGSFMIIIFTDIVFCATISLSQMPQPDFESDPAINILLPKVTQRKQSPTTFEKEFRDLIQVRCTQSKMTFLFHFKPQDSHLHHGFAYKLRDKAQLSFIGAASADDDSGNVTRCGSQGIKGGAITITTDLSLCGTVGIPDHKIDNHTVYVYKNKVQLAVPFPAKGEGLDESWSERSLNGVNMQFEVQCTYPLPSEQVDLQLEDVDQNILTPDPGRSSVTLDVNSLVYLRPVAHLKEHNKNLSTFVISCSGSGTPFLGSSISPSSILVQNGCPKEGVHTIYGRGQHGTRVGVHLKNQIFPFKLDSTIAYMHCSVILCSKEDYPYLSNIPKCPSTTYCSLTQSLGTSPSLPIYVRSAPRLAITSEPINIIGQNNEPLPADRDRCEVYCSKIVGIREQVRDAASVVSPSSSSSSSSSSSGSGLSIQATVLISLAAFVAGSIFMGIIWFIHAKTDPQRHVTSGHEPGRRLDGDANGQLIPLDVQETNGTVKQERRSKPLTRMQIMLSHFK